MKQILPQLEELNKHLIFAKKAFTKRGFRHVTQYIDGLITINKKTVKQISKASLEEKHHSAISRILTQAKFEQEMLERRYLKKIRYFMNGQRIYLIFDDTLSEHDGSHIEETQNHKDHASGSFITGHQFFTALVYTLILQLPLFPKLYSKNTDSKIAMAQDLIDTMHGVIPLYAVLFDSWYSDKKIINKCITRNIKVVCGIKTNRNMSTERGEWQSLAKFSAMIQLETMESYLIDEVSYKIHTRVAKLKGIPSIKLIVSREWDQDKKHWKEPFHLISTKKKNDTPSQIIRTYNIRWHIETYHRDIKQNLGFAKAFFRKKEAIVRHAIFSTIAYAILKLFMFCRQMKMTIGECCAYIQDKEMDNFIKEIVKIEDKTERMNYFEEVFIRKTAKV